MRASASFMMSLQPLHKDRIPVVKKQNRPNDTGTFIRHDREINSSNIVSGISCDKGFTVLNIKNI